MRDWVVLMFSNSNQTDFSRLTNTIYTGLLCTPIYVRVLSGDIARLLSSWEKVYIISQHKLNNILHMPGISLLFARNMKIDEFISLSCRFWRCYTVDQLTKQQCSVSFRRWNDVMLLWRRRSWRTLLRNRKHFTSILRNDVPIWK